MNYKHILILSLSLAIVEIKKKYLSSVLGPLWITASMGVTISIYSYVFDEIFSDLTTNYLIYLSVGSIVWSYISGVLNDAGESIISGASLIKQMPLRGEVFVLKNLFKNTLVLMHHFLFIPLLFVWKQIPFVIGAPAALLGLIVVTINLYWISYILAIISVRYRDIPPLIGSVMQILFYLTPVVWVPSIISPSKQEILNLNIFHHMIMVVRESMITGRMPWVSFVILFTIGLIGCAFAVSISKKYDKYIVYRV